MPASLNKPSLQPSTKAGQLQPAEYGSITQYGLGLTDLAKTISGSDKVLRDAHFDRGGLRAKMRRYHPRVLAFTSKRAGEEFVGHPVTYGLLEETLGPTVLFVLPSPSRAARGYWSMHPWRELARLRDDAEPCLAPDRQTAAPFGTRAARAGGG